MANFVQRVGECAEKKTYFDSRLISFKNHYSKWTSIGRAHIKTKNYYKLTVY